MCFTHAPFREILLSEGFTKTVGAVVIDECHCIVEWGNSFRTMYMDIGGIRSLVPVGTPILATSATLTPSDLTVVSDALSIDIDTSFFLNLGNDRPNIRISKVNIKNDKDLTAIKERLSAKPIRTASDIEKMIIFLDGRKKAQDVCDEIRSVLPEELRHLVTFFHSLRADGTKQDIMEQFRLGLLVILVSTEAAGMVSSFCDNDYMF